MKEIERKKNILKNISTLVIVFVLLCCNFSALAQITPDKSIQNIKTAKSSSFDPKTNWVILDENFSEGTMPPTDWTHDPTNLNGTWKIESMRYLSYPNSASVYRGLNCHGLMDEWLITPSLNFSHYLNTAHNNVISLQFWSYTDIYVVQNSLIYFNVSISTNGGVNWTKIWTSKDQSGWEQYKFILVGMPINVSEYREEANVMIGFQFYSNTEEEAKAQYYAIDDIVVSTNKTANFTCDAGGPYNWWFPRQRDYTPKGVHFAGSLPPEYNPLFAKWLWVFGDGNKSQLPTYTWNFYNKTGYYNVTLQVKYGDYIAYDNTTVYLFLLPPPVFNITLKLISFPGIQVVIDNPADFNATNVTWWINVTLGPLKMREKTVANGTISNLGNHSTAEIKSKYFFGFRLILVKIRVITGNLLADMEASYNAIKIGPFTIALGQIIPKT